VADFSSFRSFHTPWTTYYTWLPTIFHGRFFLSLFSLTLNDLPNPQYSTPSADTLRILTYTLYRRSTYCWGGGRGRALFTQV
jgi:hypothetical protein